MPSKDVIDAMDHLNYTLQSISRQLQTIIEQNHKALNPPIYFDDKGEISYVFPRDNEY